MSIRHILKQREAAWRPHLPKPLTKVSPAPEQPMQKELPDLPEEPPGTANEVSLSFSLKIKYIFYFL